MAQYKISENLALSESGFLFKANTGESFTANETGLFILKNLKEGKSEDEIINLLTEEYEVEKEMAQRDFDEFLTLIKNFDLVSQS